MTASRAGLPASPPRGRRAAFGYNRWIATDSPRATVLLGRAFGVRLRAGDVVSLVGEIGSGKTTFTRGLARGLGIKVDPSEVTSPTFVILKEYPCRVPLTHVDLYRLGEVAGADRRLIEEAIAAGGVTVIEWGDRLRGFLPEGHTEVRFRHGGGDRRMIRFAKARRA